MFFLSFYIRYCLSILYLLADTPACRSRPTLCPTESGVSWIHGSAQWLADRCSLLLLLLPRILVARVSLFLCDCLRAGGHGGGCVSTPSAASTIFSAASTPVAAAGVIISAPRPHHHQSDYGAGVTGYKCAGSPNKHTLLNLFAIRDRISACDAKRRPQRRSREFSIRSYCMLK